MLRKKSLRQPTNNNESDWTKEEWAKNLEIMHRPTDADKFRIKEILEENDITHDILVQKIEALEVVSDEIKGLLHELKGVYDEHKWCLVNDEIEAYEADASNPLTPE